MLLLPIMFFNIVAGVDSAVDASLFHLLESIPRTQIAVLVFASL